MTITMARYLLVCLLWSAGADGNPPDAGVVCTADTFDFGNIPVRDAGHCTHAFLLENRSDHTIALGRGAGSCGCTSVGTLKQYLSPGEKTTTEVKLDWSLRAGQQRETVIVKTDDEETPEVKLTLRGFIVARAVLSTHLLDFGRLPPGAKKTQVVELSQGADKAPFRVLRVDHPSAALAIERLDSSGTADPNLPLAGTAGHFAVTFTAPETRGSHDSAIVFHTDAPDQAELTVQVKAGSTGRFRIAPSMLTFLASGPDGAAVRTVQIDSPGQGITAAALESAGPGEACPFWIQGISREAVADTVRTTVTIGFVPPEANITVCQTTLRISFGKEVIDVPVLAMNKKKTGIP